jgi:hypothetical protein
MGFGMRKEVYDRKAKDAFAHRKRHDKSIGTLKGSTTAELPQPIEPVIRPETKREIVRKYVRLIFSLMAVAIILVTIYAVLLEI